MLPGFLPIGLLRRTQQVAVFRISLGALIVLAAFQLIRFYQTIPTPGRGKPRLAIRPFGEGRGGNDYYRLHKMGMKVTPEARDDAAV